MVKSGFQAGSGVKNLPANAKDTGLISGQDHPREKETRQSSCLQNSTDRGAWRATVLAVTKSWAQLSD